LAVPSRCIFRLQSAIHCPEHTSVFHPNQTSEAQRRVLATPGKFFALKIDEPFQEAASSLGQAHEHAVPLQRSSADADLDRSQDRPIHRAL
jgi:hypothetical protein